MTKKNPKNPEFGKLLSDLMKENGLSDRALAKKTGIGFSSICNYRKGREPLARILGKLADFFNITSKEFLAGKKTLDTLSKHDIIHGEKGGVIKEDGSPYFTYKGKHDDLVRKVVEILDGANRPNANLIKQNIDLCHQSKDVAVPETNKHKKKAMDAK